MRRIAFMNQKGGVGKTTTVVNLGSALARRGSKVLVIDLDAQGNLTLHLNGDPRGSERTIYDVLKGACPLPDAIRETEEPRLSVIPSSPSLAGAELEFAQAIGRETLLREAVDLLPADRFDYLFIDCPPSLGLLTLNALAAVREVVIPLQTEYLALYGMGRLLEVVALVRRRLNPALSLAGILACRYDARTHLAGEVLEEAERHFPGKLFRTRIRHNVKLAEAPSHGKTIFLYAADSNGAKDYAAFADEFLGGPPLTPSPAAVPATASSPPPAPVPKASKKNPSTPPPPAPKPVVPVALPTPLKSSPVFVPSLSRPAPASVLPKPTPIPAVFVPSLTKPLLPKPVPPPARPLAPVVSPIPAAKSASQSVASPLSTIAKPPSAI